MYEDQQGRIIELELALEDLRTDLSSTTPATTTTPSAEPLNKIQVVHSIYEAANTGDLALIEASLRSDTIWAYGTWMEHRGRDAVMEWHWEPQAIQQAETDLDPLQILIVHGEGGDWLYFRARHPGLEQVAIDEVAVRFEEGLIAEWHEGKCDPDSYFEQFLAFWCDIIER